MTPAQGLVLALGAAVFALPFLPTMLELLRESDSTPAPIPESLSVDPRDSGEQVYWFLAARLGLRTPLELETMTRELKGARSHASSTLLLEAGIALPEEVAESQVLAQGPLEVGPGARPKAKLVSMTSLKVGSSSRILEAHARGLLEFGEACLVLWWATGKEVRIGPGCELRGKISAETRATVSPGTVFNLIEAPVIELGERNPVGSPLLFVTSPFEGDLPGTIYRSPRTGRTVVAGDVVIPELAEWKGDLVVRGKLAIGEGAVIRGSVKASRGVELSRGSRVLGSVFSETSIRMGKDSRATGPVAAEDLVALEQGAKVGSVERQTTLIAQRIVARGACRVHGTARAWQEGRVEVPFKA